MNVMSESFTCFTMLTSGILSQQQVVPIILLHFDFLYHVLSVFAYKIPLHISITLVLPLVSLFLFSFFFLEKFGDTSIHSERARVMVVMRMLILPVAQLVPFLSSPCSLDISSICKIHTVHHQGCHFSFRMRHLPVQSTYSMCPTYTCSRFPVFLFARHLR